MAQLTAEQLRKVGNFDADTIANLTADLNAGADVDAVSASGALSLTRVRTELTVSGTKAYTLAAPTYANQRKVITCVSAASIPAGTLTVSSPDTTTGFVCPSTFFFDVVGQEIELVATSGLLWRCVRVKRAGGAADNVVVGTTPITNKLWARYNLSVTGSVSSTLPNGATVGERILICCSTVALGGAGTLDGTYVGGAAVAYTHLGSFGVVASTTVTGDMALLEWDGSAWNVMYQTGLTLS